MSPSSGRGLRRSRRPVRRPPSTMTPAETGGRGNEQWFRFRATSQSIILAVARRSVPARQDAGASTGGVSKTPKPDASVLVRRNEIVEALRALVPGEGQIDGQRTETLRDRRAHRLPAAADDRRAAWHDRAGFRGAGLLPSQWHQGGAARRPVRHYRGALPLADGICSASASSCILEIDYDNRFVTAQPRSLALAISSAPSPTAASTRAGRRAKSPASIGGNVTENAGGVHCLSTG